MKTLLTYSVSLFLLFSASSRAGQSDTNVTLLKVKKVTIEETVITIVVEEAKTQITLIKGDHDPDYKGDQWNGMPVTRVQVISNEATFTLKQDANNAPLWKEIMKTAKDLQDGKQVGRIGFVQPDIVIKGNMITSITGRGFLYAK